MSKKNEAEVRERAEAFRGKYPDHYKPMDTLGYVADANGIIRDLLTLLDSKQELLDEKDKVIERLPKTADGVPITPSMEVWFAGDDDPVQVDPGDGMVYDDDTYQHPSSMVYSTKELAMEAKNVE